MICHDVFWSYGRLGRAAEREWTERNATDWRTPVENFWLRHWLQPALSSAGTDRWVLSWRLNEPSDSSGDRRAAGSRFQVLEPYAAKLRWAVDIRVQGPDLQNILRQSSDFLTIMPKLRSTYDRRLIYKTSYEGCKAFLSYNSLAKS